jgi:putative peptide zinc metalloprotease protein
MSANLFSSDWYRISMLKPNVRDHITVHAHRYRGKRWYMLEDHITGQVRRLTPQSYLIFGLMNGRRKVEDLWVLSSERLGEEMPTHEEMLQLLASLYQGNLIRMEASGDIEELFKRGSDAKRKKWLGKLKSPLSIQIPIIDPNRFLTRTLKYVQPLFSKVSLALYCLFMVYALFLIGQNWDALTKNIADRVLAADNLLLMWLIYPIVKLLHELGHGYCLKRNGGEVHELGIMLLVFLPMPYVDASAATAFADKKQRMLVGMAGILVELFLAAVAVLVWVNSESGLVNSIAFNLIFIVGISTILVNGNPLLRYDGYYVLSDFLETPNLGQRANQYWGWLSKRVLFGARGFQSPAYDKREALWLFGYGVSALIYRLALMISIILFVAQQYFAIGVLLAIWSLTGTFIWPNLKILKNAWNDRDAGPKGRSPKVVIPVVAVFFIFSLAILPLPLSTSVEGVMHLKDDRRVLGGENCFIDRLHQTVGAQVDVGDLLVSCQNPRLQASKKTLAKQYAEVIAQRQGVWDDPVRIKIFDEEIARLEDEIKENRMQLDALNIYAVKQGKWWVTNADDLVGKFISRGELIGYVISDQQVSVLGMIPESEIDLVRTKIDDVLVMKSSNIYSILKPASWKVYPSATKDVVSAVLSEAGGGAVVMDPSENKPISVKRYFLIDLAFEVLPSPNVDERLLIKFVHPPEPIIYRTYRLVRRTFLTYFNV